MLIYQRVCGYKFMDNFFLGMVVRYDHNKFMTMVNL
jgi:hypothetical protein